MKLMVKESIHIDKANKYTMTARDIILKATFFLRRNMTTIHNHENIEERMSATTALSLMEVGRTNTLIKKKKNAKNKSR